MAEKNNDGFEAGQELTFDQLLAMRGKATKPEPEPEGIPTKTDIARMPKAELVEWLEAHGVEAPEGTAAELREKLTAIMFADL